MNIDKCRVVIAGSSLLLRNSNHESFLASYWRSRGLSAAATADEIAWTPYPWHVGGNVAMTHTSEELDIERMDRSEDPFTYSMEGELIFVEKVFDEDGKFLEKKSTKLLNTNWAFHKSRRRTMHRFFAKADRPSTKRIGANQLSLMFWADLSMRILEEEGDT